MAKEKYKPEKVESAVEKNPLDPGNFTDQKEWKEAVEARK
jgi:hypothetical protein